MNRKLATLLVPLMLIAVAGFGYAAFTSEITESVTAKAGTLDIDFTGAPSITCSSPSYMTCSVSITDKDTLTVTASNFAPGDYAKVTFNITNIGSLPAKLSKSVSPSPSPFEYSDNLPNSIRAGGTVTVTANITLPSKTGNDAQNVTVSFSVTITATAGS